MDSTKEKRGNGVKSDGDTAEVSHPNVSFLYKTMRERDPSKRRVKPVAHDQVQVNFGDLDDSEEDSDFEVEQDDVEEDMDDDDDVALLDEEGGDNSSESDDSDANNGIDFETNKRSSSNRISKFSFGGVDKDEAGMEAEEEEDDDDDEFETGTESDSEHDDDEEDDEMDDSDVDGKDDDHEEDASDDNASVSPGIKRLEHVWNEIDSDEDDEDYVPRKKKKKKTQKGGQDKIQKSKEKKAKSKVPTAPKKFTADHVTPQDATPQGRIKVVVCCVCLSDRSIDEDEIVECDSCGITVHEGCYGISESHSTASTNSSASTEPWFCDACKADTQPLCELCPNTGGIFKETDNGKWVHIVCALYTPGVAFGDVDKLTLVTLFEMPYSKWGAKECSLCEDSRFSQTGVCINCDAGMCKAYFHVTCAQKEGLLAQASPEEMMDVADPFFANCKLHADKMISKMKRRNWLAIQSNVKAHKPAEIGDEKEKARFQRKLSRHREKYVLSKMKRPPSFVPSQKMVRHLHTSPTAVRGFLKKAELMGLITQAQTIPVETPEMRKKVIGQPSFTTDFINYFLERNVKVDNLKIQLTDLTSQNSKLQAQERVVRKKYDQLHTNVNTLKQKETTLRREGESLCGVLQDLYGRPVPGIPEIFKRKKPIRTVSKKETHTTAPLLFNQCSECDATTDQHLMAHCDNCKKYYHLGCLDPPLTRMPKKTKLFGWQCSFCVASSSDGSVKACSDVDKPRSLRETIKGPDKFLNLDHVQDCLNSQRKKSLLNKRSKQKRLNQAKKKGNQRKSPSSAITSPKSGTAKPVQRPKQTRPVVTSSVQEDVGMQDIMCVVCNKGATLTDTVRCDECMLFYHLACLDPPLLKTPKVRGYAWHCEACDMLESSDDDFRPNREASKRPTGREASNNIRFDIDVSSDDTA